MRSTAGELQREEKNPLRRMLLSVHRPGLPSPRCPCQPAPPSSSDLRLSLFRAFTGRMTLPIPRGHIIILHAKALAAQPIITLLQFIHLKLIFQVEHHSFDAVLGDRVMFLRPATTLNRLYFNHE
ncbi:hypothetical protein [Serratia plymuthica]|uniref:hypothetical protein n=1 Tax=Serratia plymuthica TaxID=82996 RepID=UPI00128FE8E3|nr:hypothetical protein [Serratia plymuthica]